MKPLIPYRQLHYSVAVIFLVQPSYSMNVFAPHDQLYIINLTFFTHFTKRQILDLILAVSLLLFYSFYYTPEN